jgi:hypothetical protein
LIGFKDTDEPEVKQFHAVLTERLAISDNVLKPTQAEDTVLIVNECAAFPLRLIDNLQQLRNHYFQQRKRNNLLHNERSDFTDIIPPPVKVMQDLQDIFYPCLAFDLIQQNQETQQLEFQYFDELRGIHYTAALNPAWKQALQELVNNPNMAAALRELRDRVSADIEHQSAKWQGHYLPKLRQFVARVNNLPDDDINCLYRSIVVGSRATDDSSAKPGIINRFMAQMQEKVNVLPDQNTVPLAIAESQKVITGEVVGDSVVDSGDNRTKRRLELEQLKQDIEDGIITQEEYKDERQEILNKYPLRR